MLISECRLCFAEMPGQIRDISAKAMQLSRPGTAIFMHLLALPPPVLSAHRAEEYGDFPTLAWLDYAT